MSNESTYTCAVVFRINVKLPFFSCGKISPGPVTKKCCKCIKVYLIVSFEICILYSGTCIHTQYYHPGRGVSRTSCIADVGGVLPHILFFHLRDLHAMNVSLC